MNDINTVIVIICLFLNIPIIYAYFISRGNLHSPSIVPIWNIPSFIAATALFILFGLNFDSSLIYALLFIQYIVYWRKALIAFPYRSS